MLEDCRNVVFGIAQHCAVYAVMFYTSEQLYAHTYAHLHAKHVDMFSIFFQLTCATIQSQFCSLSEIRNVLVFSVCTYVHTYSPLYTCRCTVEPHNWSWGLE